MRARIAMVLCLGAAIGGCGSEMGEEPAGVPTDAEYGRALQRACEPVAAALKRPEPAVLSTPDNTLVDDAEAFDRRVARAVDFFMDAVDVSYSRVSDLSAPPEHAAFARQVRADREAVLGYTAETRRAAATANDSGSSTVVREPAAPKALRRSLPASLAGRAPSCRRLFPIDG